MEKRDWDDYDKKGIGVGGYTDNTLLGKYLQPYFTVLDVGCGRGRFLSSINAKNRFGIDISDRAINFAKNTYKDINFSCASLENLPFEDNTFDFVYSIEVIEHTNKYKQMAHEIHRVLKKGGIAYIQTPNYPTKRLYDIINFLRGKKSSIRDDYTHISKFKFWELKEVFEEKFEIVDLISRNILLHNRFNFIEKFRKNRSKLSLLLGHKIILVVKKI